MRNLPIELYVGRHRLTQVAIYATGYPPDYRMALHYPKSYDYRDMADAATPVDIKIALFEREDDSNKYYLTEVH
jgi:hypothetical protein